MKKSVGVIGGGFSGLAAASHLAHAGYDVSLFEKNTTLGGRARQFTSEGFTFDMGPSWYWMPDIFENYFKTFGSHPSEYYHLQLLDPGFRVFFSPSDRMDIPAGWQDLCDLFESVETGAADALHDFMKEARFKYEMGMHKLVYKPGLSMLEFVDQEVLKAIGKLHIITPFDKYVSRYFKNPKLRKVMEFPILFLGAAPHKTPALYSLMNYAGLVLGTWYPQGGMASIIESMASLAARLGVNLHSSSTVHQIETGKGLATGLISNRGTHPCDYVVASADYHHVDKEIIPKQANYSERYWDKRQMSPSSLLFYVGVNCKIPGLIHHNLFFDTDFDKHIHSIYSHPRWPEDPLFYACCPSKTDKSVAPAGMENLFILVPLAAGLADSDVLREQMFQNIADRLQAATGVDIRGHITYKRSYAMRDFEKDYNAFKGNAYGLANTLRQTAFLKPSVKNRHLRNLYYAGHLTVPGPGVPPALISGKIVADLIIKN